MVRKWTGPGWSIRVALAAIVAGVCLSGCGTTSSSPTPSAASTPGLARSVPDWVDIPSIGARSTLIPLGLDASKAIQTPPVDKPQQAGWYEYSPTPGQVGPAVILGHIDGDHQEGIFWRLHDLKPGATVSIGRHDGTRVTFTVTRVDEVSKSAFPTNTVYGDTTDPELRLITCGGAFDTATRNYLDNIVVYATMTS